MKRQHLIRTWAGWMGVVLMAAAVTAGMDEAHAKDRKSRNGSSDSKSAGGTSRFQQNFQQKKSQKKSSSSNGNATISNQVGNGNSSRFQMNTRQNDQKATTSGKNNWTSQKANGNSLNSTPSLSTKDTNTNRFRNRLLDRKSTPKANGSDQPYQPFKQQTDTTRVADVFNKSKIQNKIGNAQTSDKLPTDRKFDTRRFQDSKKSPSIPDKLKDIDTKGPKFPTIDNNRLGDKKPNDRKFDLDRFQNSKKLGSIGDKLKDVEKDSDTGRNRFDRNRKDILQSLDGDKKFPSGKTDLFDRSLKHRDDIKQNGFNRKFSKGDFDKIAKTDFGRKFDFKKQLDLHKDGDLARRLNLASIHDKNGRKNFTVGRVNKNFRNNHFGCWYPGPSYFSDYCWAPRWCDWVNWCWWDHCPVICDPRPIFCRPIYCVPCPRWVYYEYPVWRPLPIVTCGTWIDVPAVTINSGLDLQMLAVRFVDAGHVEQDLGPRYRVWVRNNSPQDIYGFNVLLLAGNDRLANAGLPESGVRVESIAAGEIRTVDIRLPMIVNQMGHNANGQAVPFDFLHVLVDSHREVIESFEENNGAVMARGDVLPVDPALFGADVTSASAGSIISLAGEGLGPEPGRVIVSVMGLELEAEIEGWYDLGARIALPNLPVASPTTAEIVLVRGDGAVAEPLPIEIVPGLASALPLPPVN